MHGCIMLLLVSTSRVWFMAAKSLCASSRDIYRSKESSVAGGSLTRKTLQRAKLAMYSWRLSANKSSSLQLSIKTDSLSDFQSLAIGCEGIKLYSVALDLLYYWLCSTQPAILCYCHGV